MFSTIFLILGLNPVLSMTPTTKDLLTPIREYGEACGYASCPVPAKNVLNVHIVPATHAELGNTRTFYEHYSGYEENFPHTKVNMKQILDAVITSLWEDEKRKFTFSDFPYLFHWWKNRDLTVKRMVYQLLRQGRLFFVGGGWSMSDEATTSYHAIIDHFTYSLRKLNATFLDCGRPLVTWQADVFGHSKEFASLMAQMGFDGHFINPISFDDEIARMKAKALEFVWRGSDDLGSDSDIYTHKLFDGYWSPPGFCFGAYCKDPLIMTSDSLFANVAERVEVFMDLMTRRQGPYYTTTNVMVIMGVRLGYFDAPVWFANIDKLINNVNMNQQARTKRAYLFYSTPACYLKAVRDSMPTLSTKQDDFYPFSYDKDTQGSGAFTSRPHVKNLARELHLYLQIAKHLQIFGKLGNNDQKFEDIMWIHGVLQDHTIITGGSQPRVIDYYSRKVFLAKSYCLSIFRQAFNNLRGSPSKVTYNECQFNISSCPNIQTDRFSIVIYNPLAWPVTTPVRLPIARGIYKIFDPKGVQQNHSVITIADLVTLIPGRGKLYTEDELVFIAENLPPMGYRSYFVEQVQVRTRVQRSIIKKLNKKSKKKKFLTRQTNNLKIDDKGLLDEMTDYEYFEDTSEKSLSTLNKIQFGNFSKGDLGQYDYIVTPPTRIVPPMTTEESQDLLLRKMGYSTTKLTSPPTRSTTTITPVRTTQKSSIKGTQNPSSIKGTENPSLIKGAPNPFTNNETQNPFSIKGTPSPFTVNETQNPITRTTETPFLSKGSTPNNVEYEYYEDSTDPLVSTTPYFDFDKVYRRMEKSGYHSVESDDNFIKNEYIQINLDANRKLSSIALSNGVNITFTPQICYYVSDDPEKFDKKLKRPGAHIFRPIDPHPVKISSNYEIKILKSDIVEEIQIIYAVYAGLTFKLYRGLPTIEVDWHVGPIPIGDNLGKEVFVRYETNVENKGVFFTDSNGRQTVKRIRDVRATYTPVLDSEVSRIASNTYPVTTKLYIEDLEKNIRLSIFTDRSQGGTSLTDGTIDMMLHRRILTDDLGARAWLDEKDQENGLIIRGKHHLYISKADYRPNKVFEKKFAKELELKPTVFASHYNLTYKEWLEKTNEYSGLKNKLPVGVHILTIERWNDNFLLRLENYLEKSDIVRNGLKRVFLKELFTDFTIVSVKETTLSGTVWLEDRVPFKWKTDRFVKNFNNCYGNKSIEFAEDQGFTKSEPVSLDKGIELKPQQIRTFVVSYTRV